MMVQCIDNVNMRHSLTMLKRYQVIEVIQTAGKYKFFRIMDDNGCDTNYNANRFKLVEEDDISKFLNHTIQNKLVITPSGTTNKSLLDSSDDYCVCIKFTDSPIAYEHIGYEQMVDLRDYLDGFIKHLDNIGYQPPKKMTQKEVENLLGFRVKITK